MKKILAFTASWCQPCKNFKPILEQISREIPVEFIDVDSNPHMTTTYGIRNVPTIVILNNGRAVAKQSGVLTESQIKNLWSQN